MNFSWASNYDDCFNTSNTDFTRVINICKNKKNRVKIYSY